MNEEKTEQNKLYVVSSFSFFIEKRILRIVARDLFKERIKRLVEEKEKYIGGKREVFNSNNLKNICYDLNTLYPIKKEE